MDRNSDTVEGAKKESHIAATCAHKMELGSWSASVRAAAASDVTHVGLVSGQPTVKAKTDSLIRCGSSTYRAFVLNKHPYTMWPMLWQLLHNLGEIDCREKISPGEFSDEFNILLVCLAIWTSVRPGHRLSRGTQHVIFRSIGLSRPCKIELAEPEEAVVLSEKAV